MPRTRLVVRGFQLHSSDSSLGFTIRPLIAPPTQIIMTQPFEKPNCHAMVNATHQPITFTNHHSRPRQEI